MIILPNKIFAGTSYTTAKAPEGVLFEAVVIIP
jgi:hypothetical protein